MILAVNHGRALGTYQPDSSSPACLFMRPARSNLHVTHGPGWATTNTLPFSFLTMSITTHRAHHFSNPLLSHKPFVLSLLALARQASPKGGFCKAPQVCPGNKANNNEADTTRPVAQTRSWLGLVTPSHDAAIQITHAPFAHHSHTTALSSQPTNCLVPRPS